jgi:alkanesulfonate monooxygenase SsuD/methylene tetrahydromethanopterin reductase-like flavin-dependent oxidoreductase (luciferase family)
MRRVGVCEDCAVKVGLGSITCQATAGDARTDGERYRDALALAEEAERLEFDSIWLSEHHFVDDGYLPSLLVMAAAIAARTSRIAVGTDVLLATLHEPVRLAEDAAVVDLLSGGRLILGIAQGWREVEFAGLRVPYRGRHLRLEDTVETLRQAWGTGLVTGGPTVPYPGIPVTPKPERAGGPPVWIGADAEPAVRRAGRIADGFMGSWSRPEAFARRAGWVVEELERRGADPATFGWSVVVPVLPHGGEPMWLRVRDAMHHYVWKYQDMVSGRDPLEPPAAPPPLTAEVEAKLRRLVAAGEPEELAAALRRYADAVPGELHLVTELAWPALAPSLRDELVGRFAAEVLPLLRG